MRFRVGVILCIFAVYSGVGCREVLQPGLDNQAPETWITAAPFDTITVEKGTPPTIGTIPVRFHVYWAGSDKDGAVAGFYWAVTETLPRPPEGSIFVPSLPGPKPRDYHFTTNTDSFFVFNVAEDIPDRQHAFFVYAVDNLGRPDPTPARFIFIAQDRYPPIPIIEMARGIGTIYSLKPGGGVVARRDTFFVTDIDNRFTLPRDTLPSGSTITFRWRAEPATAGGVATGYRYKLDEPKFVEVDSSVREVTYSSYVGADTVRLAPGTKIFVLRAVDQASGTRDSTRRFQLNFSPDTWFSGPDLSSPSFLSKPNGEKYALLVGGELPAPIVGSLLSPDSTLIFPALRPERRTFFEIWKDTLYARSEGDTVHMNSWIILHSGGFDPDSRYQVAVSDLGRTVPGFPGGPVLDPAPPNGSPIGFRSVITLSLTPVGNPSRNAQSGLYPVCDPNDVFNLPRIGYYTPVFQAGRAYALARAEDGDGARDGRISDARAFIEFGQGDQSLRSKILVFEVDKPPVILTESPLFRPRTAEVDTFTSRTWDLRLPADDIDPYEPGTPLGGPSRNVTLRRRITIRGLNAANDDSLKYSDKVLYLNQQDITFLVPAELKAGRVLVDLEFCDCGVCEDVQGTGRCVTLTVPVEYRPAVPTQSTSSSASRPGLEEQSPRSGR